MSHKSKILIVDDEPLNVKLLAAMLPAEKYVTILAYSGDEARKIVTIDEPDLILPDVMMPVTNGLE